MNLELLVITAGIVGGICSSAPLGIINLWITDAVLAKNEQKIVWFVVGVIIADVAHGAMASWGYHEFLQKSGFERWIGLIGGGFVMVMGLMSLREAKPVKTPIGSPITKKAHEFSLGLMMCGLNPGFLVFWMFVIDQIESKINHQVEGISLLYFLAGVIIGDGIWFSFIVSLAKKGREHVNPRNLKIIRTSIAYFFVLVGIYAVIMSIRGPSQHPISFLSNQKY